MFACVSSTPDIAVLFLSTASTCVDSHWRRRRSGSESKPRHEEDALILWSRVEVKGGRERRVTRLRFLPCRPENQDVELLVLALLGLTGNEEVFRGTLTLNKLMGKEGLQLLR